MALSCIYCECGCQGHGCELAPGISFWIYADGRGRFTLHRGHRYNLPKSNDFKTFEMRGPDATRPTAGTGNVRFSHLR
jgi:hypothetical protein